ncbi:MAG: hypothetical protein L0228_16005 [Planctomycetes bacterium]|nr:hypothetical protein [Planctomycetota bacterium]
MARKKSTGQATGGAPQEAREGNEAAGGCQDEPRPGLQTETPYVVGIGASAGGLQPLQEFFGNMPQDSGLAFVIVQHLSPEFKSLMSELLSRRHTSMAMHHVEHGMLLEPNSIYGPSQ